MQNIGSEGDRRGRPGSLALRAPIGKSTHQFLAVASFWSPVLILVAIGLAWTIVAFLVASRAEERRVVKMLDFRVEWRAKDLRAKVNLAREALVATAIHA